jgi:hypothetical protein
MSINPSHLDRPAKRKMAIADSIFGILGKSDNSMAAVGEMGHF